MGDHDGLPPRATLWGRRTTTISSPDNALGREGETGSEEMRSPGGQEAGKGMEFGSKPPNACPLLDLEPVTRWSLCLSPIALICTVTMTMASVRQCVRVCVSAYPRAWPD